MSYDFTGKCALVTGASRGIGKAVTEQLVKCGAKVYGLSKNPDNLAALKKELPDVETLCVNIRHWKETRELVEKIEVIDILVNNAGVNTTAMFQQATEEEFDDNCAVNVKPIINISQVVFEKLRSKGKPGSIVNVSSIVSRKCFVGTSVYGSGKSCVDRLTRQMAAEMAEYGIRVNSVNPTAVETDMVKALNENTLKQFKKTIPLGDICSAHDVADSVLFLLSDKARMITGVNLLIDGGQSVV